MCRDPMRKHGRTASGSQRWRCTACNLTTTAPRAVPPARTEQATLGEFIAWATSKGTQADQPGGARAFRRRTAWCWRVPVPRPPVTGEVHAQIFIDGLHLAGGWTLLVARSTAHVIAWQWAAGESAAAYTALLQDLAPPDLVTTDGAGGALKALRELWPRTPVQRCLIHVHRDTVRDLTLHPRTRRAHRRLERLAKQGTLFAYLTGPAGEPRHTPLERTTNPVEAINAQVRATLRHHRGAGPDHQAAIIDWTLARLTEQPPTPTQALKAWNQDGRRPAARLPTRKTRTSARPHPAGWGTTPTPEEGLWTRKGWAGRTH